MSKKKRLKVASQGIGSVEKAFAVLNALAASSGPTRLVDIVHRAGMPASLAHAYLTTLQRIGAVNKDAESGRYDLGVLLTRLGLTALSRMDFRIVARKVMNDLRDEIEQTIWLSVWSDQGPVIIDKAEPAIRSQFEVRFGLTAECTVSATGRAYLAFLPRSVWKHIAERERRRPELFAPSEAKLEALLNSVRRDMISARDSAEDSKRGSPLPYSLSLAAPIFDHGGDIKAALTIFTQPGTADMSVTGKNAQALKTAASSLSASLGYMPAANFEPAPQVEGSKRRRTRSS
jgi:DNA-binding IclR family transcriptional regulator